MYSGNLADYPAFVKKWKSPRQRCSVQDDQLCEIFRERCMPPNIARRLMYFFSMSQVWDFLEVAVEKPRRSMEACVAAVGDFKPVKQADSECLWIQYEELRVIGSGPRWRGVYVHLLMEAVANKILNKACILFFHDGKAACSLK
jgi:hypothetical protein